LQSEVTHLIAALGLVHHPEGGWYKETYRAGMKVATPKGERDLATLIYYLLPSGVESRIHRVSWDEIWLWQGGGVLDVRSHDRNEYRSHLLGHTVGATPQVLMPAGTWFNAVVAEGDYVLAACMVAPGFDFADLEML
jgi:predicted cupin superfamily sugar epimerase